MDGISACPLAFGWDYLMGSITEKLKVERGWDNYDCNFITPINPIFILPARWKWRSPWLTSPQAALATADIFIHSSLNIFSLNTHWVFNYDCGSLPHGSLQVGCFSVLNVIAPGRGKCPFLFTQLCSALPLALACVGVGNRIHSCRPQFLKTHSCLYK